MKAKLTKNLFFILCLDAILVAFSFWFAYAIRFDFHIPEWAFANFISSVFFLIVIKIICFFVFDLYRGMWRYTGLNDLMNVGKASIAATVCAILFVLYTTGFHNIPRSVFIIDWFLTLIVISGLRVAARVYFEQVGLNGSLADFIQALLKIFRKTKAPGTDIIVIGAGNCGETLLREIHGNSSVKYNVCGFLDDDPGKIGRKIHGISVLDKIDSLENIVQATGIKDAIISIPSISAARMRQIIDLCKKAQVEFKTVPAMGELINGKITVNSIRNVEYRDLLGREPVDLDKKEIGRYLGQKTVFITGAGGSIGTGLCRQICRYKPGTIVLFERAESPLYEIDLELKNSFDDITIIPVLGDIQDIEELDIVFELTKPDIVFHAAAYKHVPMLEKYPWKAVANNIAGTRNLVEAAHRFECEKFVFVSTDKAVNPCNVMGASKRVSEMIVQNQNLTEQSKTKYITVRFGNVIGSVGSVIPLFKKQIEKGGPVTVTHPDIIRYFMLIPEACQLILQAGAMGEGGEIFILEMGKPVKIDNMAKELIRFSGFEPEVDIKIEYTGLRPGEKLYEELMTASEDVIPTGHDKIMILKSRKIDINLLNNNFKQLKKEAQQQNSNEIRKLLNHIVPEYSNGEEV
jgi:FlaA1/EpsC-like NDP-sugar epimerase